MSDPFLFEGLGREFIRFIDVGTEEGEERLERIFAFLNPKVGNAKSKDLTPAVNL